VFVFEIANKDWWVVLASLAVYVKKQLYFDVVVLMQSNRDAFGFKQLLA
jgi:hypothetical protein